jgi:hypothetical protein
VLEDYIGAGLAPAFLRRVVAGDGQVVSDRYLRIATTHFARRGEQWPSAGGRDQGPGCLFLLQRHPGPLSSSRW